MLPANGECHNFFLIWSPALSLCRKQNRKGNPSEPCQPPRAPPGSGGGSEGLCCTSAKLPKCKGHPAFPWDSSVSITYTDKAEESFSFRQAEGGLRKRNVKKKEKAWGPLQKRVHRSRGTQTGSPHYQSAFGSASGSVFIWATVLSVVSAHHACKNGFFVLVSFCFFHWGNPIALCTSLPLTTPGSLLSQGWRLWLLAVSKRG